MTAAKGSRGLPQWAIGILVLFALWALSQIWSALEKQADEHDHTQRRIEVHDERITTNEDEIRRLRDGK